MVTAMTITALSALGQEEGPILLPKPKPVAKPASPTLLVMCDLACNWKLDGEAKGRIEAGGSAKVKVELGQHMVVAVTEDGADQVKQLSEVKTTGQTVVSIELKPVRDARLKTDQEARDKAAQEAKDRAAQEQAVRDETARLEDLHDHAAERFSQGKALYDQKRFDEARPLFEKSCDGGEMRSCANLGLLYSHGQGVSQDYAQARPLYQKACNGGEMAGCNNLGWLYANGYGVAKDYAQARSLYQKACNGGIEQACTSLHNLR
jgi:tetratricopeptide (TPR) repeat protein